MSKTLLRIVLRETSEHYENRLCDIFDGVAFRSRIPDPGRRAIEKLQSSIRSNSSALRRGNREPVETFREAFEKPGILFKVKARGGWNRSI